MTIRTSPRAIACALYATTALATPALATPSTYPLYRNWDENNVDVVRGDFRLNFEDASIGSGKARLSTIWQNTSLTPFQWDNRPLTQFGAGSAIARKPDGSYFSFSGGVSNANDGATLAQSQDPVTFNFAEEITDRDGVRYLYSDLIGADAGSTYCTSAGEGNCNLALSRITYPDGTIVSVNNSTWRNTTSGIYSNRVVSVSNNFGYSIVFTFQSGCVQNICNFPSGGGASDPPGSWYTRTKSSLQQNGVEQASLSYSYPVSGTVDITDPAGKVWELTATSIKKPGDSTPSFTVTNSASTGLVSSVTNAGVTTTYGRSVVGNIVTLTKTDPLGKATVITSDQSLDHINSVKDPLNRTTSYGYDSGDRLTSITNPEGDGTDYVLDARGNATQIKHRPKTGSASPSLITTQTFASTCVNAVTCNKPTQIKDPANNATDITYDPTHGGALTVTRPAPTTGAVRPQTRYTYTLTNVGPSSSPGQVYLLTKVSECQTLSSCANAADEVKTVIGYDAFGDPTSVAKGNGNGTLTATNSMIYDGMGNLLTVDGPLSGTADTMRYRYDANRRVIGVTSPDPDGAGSLLPRAIRTTYDGAGRVTKQELGNVADQSDAAWAAFSAAQTVDIGLDANGRVKTRQLSGSSGGAVALTQTSYDADGRLQCSAVRMNPAAFTTLPADACTLGTAGSFGPDRITKAIYDDAGEVTQAQEAVGTSDAATERTLTYSNDGDLATLKDAENNLTTYTYDEYDRRKQTQFPSPTKGAGTSNASDYEQLGYDTRGNVTSRRLRDGNSIAYTYDNLNRVTLKDLPGTEPDVTYGYDNLDRLTSASQTGNALTFGYDALSDKTSEGGPNGTTAFTYDLAGEKTAIIYSTSGGAAPLTINYAYLTTGELDTIEKGATAFADYSYDNLGNRTGVTFGSGASQVFGYDPVSRLASLTVDLAGTTQDFSATYAYNPASQIVSTVRTGDAYAWTGSGSGSTDTVANGLNQLSSVGGVSATYDAKGNLTTDPTRSKTYSYSSENLLTSASLAGGTTLSYDPLLRLYQVASSAPTTRYAYDGLNAIALYDSSNALVGRTVFDPTTGEQVGSVNPAGTPGYTAHDERGSVIANVNSTGQALFIDSYDEYGKPGSANNGRYGFTGQLWIPDGGLRLYYYKSRFYEPPLGRFLQPDPIGYADSPNLYDYVLGDPVNNVDPLGLQSCTDEQQSDQKNQSSGSDSGGGGGSGGCESNSQGDIIITGTRRPPQIDQPADNWANINVFQMAALLRAGATTHNYILEPIILCRATAACYNAIKKIFPSFVVPNLDQPVSNGQESPVYPFEGAPFDIGHVVTYFWDNGLGATNITLSDHWFCCGQVDIHNYASGGFWYVSAHGYGSNYSGVGPVNQALGPGIFSGMLQTYASVVRATVGGN